MEKKYVENTALFRFSVISPVINPGPETKDLPLAGRIALASERTYVNPSGKYVSVSFTSVERWYYAYKKDGFDGLKPKGRSDTGKSRKADEDIIAAIRYYRERYPRIPATVIHQNLISTGKVAEGEISLSTVTRISNSVRKEMREYTGPKEMRRYERSHINEVWCGDSSAGPYITVDKKKRRVWVIALIDDASRMITGIDVFLNDNYLNVMSVIKKAVVHYGKPSWFNFDNGSPYKNHQMDLLCARIGTTIRYCTPGTPTQKGKIERWFRTMKDLWMSTLNTDTHTTLDDIRKSLLEFTQNYNRTVHTSLNGLTPEDRFFSEYDLIKRLSDKTIAESFLIEEERKVSVDSVVVLEGREYEADYRYAGQKLTLRYTPDLKEVYVYDRGTGSLTPIKLLDKKANSTVRRVEKVKFTQLPFPEMEENI